MLPVVDTAQTSGSLLRMTGVEMYRQAFEHEIDANHGMLKMLAGVPADHRGDGRFQRALIIAAHMCAVRANFLKMILGDETEIRPWFEERVDHEELDRDFGLMETAWSRFLSGLDDDALGGSFTFPDNGAKWRMSLNAQLFQLVGHAAYHRGQVVLLVDQVGGETFDTDYIEWFTRNFPDGSGRVG